MTATPKPRSQIIMPGDTVRLKAVFRGSNGSPVDLDTFPTVTIVQPDGMVALGPTSAGVFREGVGSYGFDYQVSLHPSIGIYRDLWEGELNGFKVMGEFLFVVHVTQMPAVNSDGYVHLGDDPGYDYSQNAIKNINHLLKTLRTRLKSSGQHKTKDEHGNDIVVSCDIYSTETLVDALAWSLSAFNETPHFTLFTFEHSDIIEQFHAVLVQGAALILLASQSLVERGREYTITDNGVNLNIPTVSELLNTQYSTELNNWFERVKLIKHNMKPAALGLGTLRPMTASPQIRRLRTLRARQIF